MMRLFKSEKPPVNEILDPAQSLANLHEKAQTNKTRAANWSGHANKALFAMFVTLVSLHFTCSEDSYLHAPLNILFGAFLLTAMFCIASDSYYMSRSNLARNEEESGRVVLQLTRYMRAE